MLFIGSHLRVTLNLLYLTFFILTVSAFIKYALFYLLYLKKLFLWPFTTLTKDKLYCFATFLIPTSVYWEYKVPIRISYKAFVEAL